MPPRHKSDAMAGEQVYGVPDEENPEWTAEDFRNAKSFTEVFPDLIVNEIARRRGRGPQKAPRKQMLSIRLDADVLEKWRATGKGWQGRMNDALGRLVRDAPSDDIEHVLARALVPVIVKVLAAADDTHAPRRRSHKAPAPSKPAARRAR